MVGKLPPCKTAALYGRECGHHVSQSLSNMGTLTITTIHRTSFRSNSNSCLSCGPLQKNETSASSAEVLSFIIYTHPDKQQTTLQCNMIGTRQSIIPVINSSSCSGKQVHIHSLCVLRKALRGVKQATSQDVKHLQAVSSLRG